MTKKIKEQKEEKRHKLLAKYILQCIKDKELPKNPFDVIEFVVVTMNDLRTMKALIPKN